MLTEIVLCPDGKKPQKLSFDDLFNYKGKKNLKKIKSFQAKANTSDMTLSYLGDFLPGLQILRLDYSSISGLRDLSTPLPNLKVLSLTHCELSSIDGIATISNRIQELYLGFNFIDDVSPLLGFNSLKILDLESNLIGYVEDVALLKCCTALRDLTLKGTGAPEHPEYRSEIKRLIPKLQILDGIKYGEENKPEEEEKLPPLISEPAPPPPEVKFDANLPLPSLNNKGITAASSSGKAAANGSKPHTPASGGQSNRASDRPNRLNRMVTPKTRAPRQKGPTVWHNIGSIRL